ncbi:hypothetical protein ACFX15_013564 [Malus domestica]
MGESEKRKKGGLLPNWRRGKKGFLPNQEKKMKGLPNGMRRDEFQERKEEEGRDTGSLKLGTQPSTRFSMLSNDIFVGSPAKLKPINTTKPHHHIPTFDSSQILHEMVEISRRTPHGCRGEHCSKSIKCETFSFNYHY